MHVDAAFSPCSAPFCEVPLFHSIHFAWKSDAKQSLACSHRQLSVAKDIEALFPAGCMVFT